MPLTVRPRQRPRVGHVGVGATVGLGSALRRFWAGRGPTVFVGVGGVGTFRRLNLKVQGGTGEIVRFVE
jgi:hypothetical protein